MLVEVGWVPDVTHKLRLMSPAASVEDNRLSLHVFGPPSSQASRYRTSEIKDGNGANAEGYSLLWLASLPSNEDEV